MKKFTITLILFTMSVLAPLYMLYDYCVRDVPKYPMGKVK